MKKLIFILLFLSFACSQSVITGVKDMSITGLDSTASLGDIPAGMITMLNKGGTSTQAQWGLSFSDITDRFGSVAFGGYSRDNSATNSFAKTYSDSGYVFLEVQYSSNIDGEADFIRKTVANDGVVWDVVNATTSHDMSYLLFGGGQAWSKVGQFNPSGSIGNQLITGVGGTPNAVLFMSYQENDGGGHVGNNEPDGRLNFGFMADNGGQFAISSNIRGSNLLAYQGASATNAYNTITASAINDYFSYVSMDVDGFTINWGSAESSNDYIQYMAIGGVEAYVDTTVMRTSTGTFSESGFGFQPDFIIGARTTRATSGASSSPRFGIGFASGTGTTEQYYMTFSARNNQDPTETDQHSDDTYFLLGTTNTGAVESFLDIDSFDADGVTFNQIDASPNPAMFGYLAIKILDVSVVEEDNALFFGINF